MPGDVTISIYRSDESENAFHAHWKVEIQRKAQSVVFWNMLNEHSNSSKTVDFASMKVCKQPINSG